MSKYTYEDFRADERSQAEKAYKAKVVAWLKSRLEVGTLNSGIFYTNFPYTEIEVFSK